LGDYLSSLALSSFWDLLNETNIMSREHFNDSKKKKQCLFFFYKPRIDTSYLFIQYDASYMQKTCDVAEKAILAKKNCGKSA